MQAENITHQTVAIDKNIISQKLLVLEMPSVEMH